MKGTVYEDNSHTFFEPKEATANFIMNIPTIELPHVIANKICRSMFTSMWGQLLAFVIT
jgi:hypothetical protein